MNKIIVTMLLTSFVFSGDADDVRKLIDKHYKACLLYTSPSPRDRG